MPRIVASCPAASASKHRKRFLVRFLISPSWRSVSAVPIAATAGSNPAWRNAIASGLPSTTSARFCFAIAALARSSP
jgi:hypothetical protein